MSTYHARLSPSGFDRWSRCPGSIELSAQYSRSNTSSPDAEYGTAAHELAALCLDPDGPGRAIREYLGVSMSNGIVVDAEMVDGVQDYIDLINERVAQYETLKGEVELLIEQKVSIDHLTGEEGATGTSDCVMVVRFPHRKSILEVIDLKFGAGVAVSAVDNGQLRMYASGALRLFPLEEVETVRMTICQPRVRPSVTEEQIDIQDLLDWEMVDCRMAAQAVAPGAPLRAGEKQCKFCPAKAECPELRWHVETWIGVEIEALNDTDGKTMAEMVDALVEAPDHGLSDAMNAVELIEIWCKGVRAEVERRLFAGAPVPGWKLVEGRRGHRKWLDDVTAEKFLRNVAKLKIDDAMPRQLISPADAEKKLKKNPAWKKAAEIIVQPAGKPSVAPFFDPRPAVVIGTVEGEIENLDAEVAALL